MAESLVGRISTSGWRVVEDRPQALRLRSVRWTIQAVLVALGMVHPVAWCLVPAVLPLVLDSPIRRLATPRGRIIGHTSRLLGVACVGIDPSHLVGGLASMFAAVVQSGLVLVVAFVLSRNAVPLLGPR
jgi:hypothetical protein